VANTCQLYIPPSLLVGRKREEEGDNFLRKSLVSHLNLHEVDGIFWNILLCPIVLHKICLNYYFKEARQTSFD